jgi:hypothetical protein
MDCGQGCDTGLAVCLRINEMPKVEVQTAFLFSHR